MTYPITTTAFVWTAIRKRHTQLSTADLQPNYHSFTDQLQLILWSYKFVLFFILILIFLIFNIFNIYF